LEKNNYTSGRIQTNEAERKDWVNVRQQQAEQQQQQRTSTCWHQHSQGFVVILTFGSKGDQA
jgi:hypothetical protein